MSTLCPYCNMEVSESAIEAEDGCCPECGSMIGAPGSSLGEEYEDYDDDRLERDDYDDSGRDDDDDDDEDIFENEDFEEDIFDGMDDGDFDDEEFHDDDFDDDDDFFAKELPDLKDDDDFSDDEDAAPKAKSIRSKK